MSIKTSYRHALVAAAATCALAGTVGAAPAQAAHAATHPRADRAAAAQRAAAAGFRPVRTVAGTVIAMTSPAAGQLWVVERMSDGKLLLERKNGTRWRLHRLPITITASDDVQISGSARNDVWLAAGDQLWHFDGGSWTRVATPAGTTAEAVADVAGPDVYVGLNGDMSNTGVYKVSGTTWTSLGRPADDTRPVPAWRPYALKVVDGNVYGEWAFTPQNATYHRASFAYRNGT